MAVDCADALLETQQTLVDFSAFHLSIFIIVLAVRCPFTASQINKEQLAALLNALFLNLNLAYSVRATRGIIRPGCVGCPDLVTRVNQF